MTTRVTRIPFPSALLAALLLLPVFPYVGGDPVPGVDPWGPQYRNANWSFDTPGNYTRLNTGIATGDATLLSSTGGFTWSTDADFAGNGSVYNATIAVGGVRLAGDASELAVNGGFFSPANWTFTSSPPILASAPPFYGGFNGTAGMPPLLFDSMNSTTNWTANGPGASLSLNTTDFSEPNASITVSWNPLLQDDFGGARRAGGFNFAAYKGMRLWTNTSEGNANVYLRLADTVPTVWDSPNQSVGNAWAPHDFDFNATAVNLSSLLFIEIRFTNLTGGTRRANVDNLTLYARTQLNEMAGISQVMSKPNVTLPIANQTQLRFDLTAVSVENATATLETTLANASGTFTDARAVTAPFSGAITLDPSLNVTAAGDYNLSVALHVEANTTEAAAVEVHLDNVSFIAP